MIKISQVVQNLIQEDEIALESLRANILNLSAYAQILKPKIDSILYKDVRLGSIVTALSRVRLALPSVEPLRVKVKINNINIKSPLCEVTYEKTKENLFLTKQLNLPNFYDSVFSITQGVSEIAIIVNQNSLEDILQNYSVKPKGVYKDLVALTISFNQEDYIEVPNTIYSLVALLASKRINLIEIVSTYTEISFIVRQSDTKTTLDVLKGSFEG